MLEARGIDASDGRLKTDVRGAVEKDEGVLVIRRIHVRHTLAVGSEAAGARDKIRRAFELHPMRCPVYRTLYRCIDVTTELTLAEE